MDKIDLDGMFDGFLERGPDAAWGVRYVSPEFSDESAQYIHELLTKGDDDDDSLEAVDVREESYDSKTGELTLVTIEGERHCVKRGRKTEGITVRGKQLASLNNYVPTTQAFKQAWEQYHPVEINLDIVTPMGFATQEAETFADCQCFNTQEIMPYISKAINMLDVQQYLDPDTDLYTPDERKQYLGRIYSKLQLNPDDFPPKLLEIEISRAIQSFTTIVGQLQALAQTLREGIDPHTSFDFDDNILATASVSEGRIQWTFHLVDFIF